MASKKEFIGEVITQIMLSTKSGQVFKGHGLPLWVLREIKARPDLALKFANILSSLKGAARGISGFKRAKNFQIKAYKNFAALQGTASDDIAAFVAGLPADDAAKWSNDQIVVIALTPDKMKQQWDAYMDANLAVPVSGKSVVLSFDKVIQKKYSAAGTAYICFMVGDSAVRPKDAKIAIARDKKNGMLAMKIAKTSRKRLTSEAAELKKLNKEILKLKAQKADLSIHARQQAALGSQRAMRGDRAVGNVLSSFYASNGITDTAMYERARSLWAAGKKTAARRTLAGEIFGDDFLAILERFNPTTTVDARSAKATAKLKEINNQIAFLVDDLDEATSPAEITALKRKITALKKQAKQVKTQVGILKSNIISEMHAEGYTYADMLREVTERLKAAEARGLELKTAMRAAVQQLPVSQQVKQQIAQQALQQVATQQIAPQFAVQQALQTQLQQLPTQLEGSMSAGDILNSLGITGAAQAMSGYQQQRYQQAGLGAGLDADDILDSLGMSAAVQTPVGGYQQQRYQQAGLGANFSAEDILADII